jgi:hypothetical protein
MRMQIHLLTIKVIKPIVSNTQQLTHVYIQKIKNLAQSIKR